MRSQGDERQDCAHHQAVSGAREGGLCAHVLHPRPVGRHGRDAPGARVQAAQVRGEEVRCNEGAREQ